MSTSTPVDCVDLVLYSPSNHDSDQFYLRIPISFINDHYTRPLKFLFYLGWCILGVMGDLFIGGEHIALSDAGPMQLQPGGRYSYRPEDDEDIFKYAVDMKIIKPKTRHNSSQSTARDPDFAKILRERDRWLQLIVGHRLNDEAEIDLESVDDVRNGMLAITNINKVFDARNAVIIKTPNRVLDEDDVVPRFERELEDDVSYPTDIRYTFQYLKKQERRSDMRLVPDNNDATFPTTPSANWPRPSALLLNYNFGAAAVHHWGQNKVILENRPGIQRPEVMVAPMDPQRTPGKKKRDKYVDKKQKLEEQEEDKQREAGPSGTVQDADKNGGEDEETGQEWDADDIMLFFWANSGAAKERQEREEKNLKNSIEDWKATLVVE